MDELDEITLNNKVDYAVVYGEFMYKAGSWPYERRVVCKVEKPENQMVYMYTFVVTNMDASLEVRNMPGERQPIVLARNGLSFCIYRHSANTIMGLNEGRAKCT